MRATFTVRERSSQVLAAIFVLSGVTHLVRPQVFEPIMPRMIPERGHRALIYLSGVAEVACAVGLGLRRRWAATASVVVLSAVFPANVQMAVDSGSGRNPGLADNRMLAWARLPLQIPMIKAAWNLRSTGS